jgi:hypothetical protein
LSIEVHLCASATIKVRTEGQMVNRRLDPSMAGSRRGMCTFRQHSLGADKGTNSHCL